MFVLVILRAQCPWRILFLKVPKKVQEKNSNSTNYQNPSPAFVLESLHRTLDEHCLYSFYEIFLTGHLNPCVVMSQFNPSRDNSLDSTQLSVIKCHLMTCFISSIVILRCWLVFCRVSLRFRAFKFRKSCWWYFGRNFSLTCFSIEFVLRLPNCCSVITLEFLYFLIDRWFSELSSRSQMLQSVTRCNLEVDVHRRSLFCIGALSFHTFQRNSPTSGYL